MPVRSFIYRHRLLAKRVIAAAVRLLPGPASRRLLAWAERVAFSVTPQYQGDTLPPICHYWTGRYVADEARRLGFGSAEALYHDRIVQRSRETGDPVRVASAGCGAAGMEIELARRLKSEGVPILITCFDFNPALMRRAADTAQAAGVADSVRFEVRDCNQPFALTAQDVIIVNQFFHHVTALETFCASLQQSLAPEGVLLSSDIIGRNGHQPWPDAALLIERFWAELAPAKRHDRHFGNVRENYSPIDHAAYSNEGVRAQDVVACLLAAFDFELFYSFGGAIMPFVERRLGFNFDPADVADRAFIDSVQEADANALAQGQYPASNMVAVLRHHGRVAQPVHVPISPQRHVELTKQQRRRLAEPAKPARTVAR
ncbi:MAG: class I SAM-dependent methyltransferase [Rhodanobacter sp.]